jgi:hypothetical protein
MQSAGVEAAQTLLLEVPTYVEYASSIILPDGPYKGESYDPNMHPGQICFMQALDAGYSRAVVAKPVQDGGTLATLVPLMRRAIVEHQAVLMAYPSLDSSKDIWTTKAMPILMRYGGQMPKSGGGSRGGAARVITLPGGGRFILRAAGGRGESQQASVSGDCIGVDEVDDWPSLHRLQLITERVDKAADPLAIYVSTVKKDKNSNILLMWQRGTATRIEVPCTHCGVFQVMEWDHIDQEVEAYRCPHCEKHWSNAERLASLKLWRRKDTNEGASVFSIRWTALDSPFSVMTSEGRKPTIPGLCSLYRDADAAKQERGDHDLLRAFYRDRLTSQYILDVDTDGMATLSPNDLQARSAASQWGRPLDKGGTGAEPIMRAQTDRVLGTEFRTFSRHVASVPRDVQYCAVGVDVQADRMYWLLLGIDNQQRQYDIAWGYEHATVSREPMTRAQIWMVLDRIDAVVTAIVGSTPLVAKGVDANYRTDEIVSWLALHPQWMPCIGASQSKIERANGLRGDLRRTVPGVCVEYSAADWKLRQPRINIDTHPVRQLAQNSFLVQIGQPGSAMLPYGIELKDSSAMTYLRHLCAEQWEPVKRKWVKVGQRWDWLDCRVYALALLLRHLRQSEAAAATQRQITFQEPDAGPGEYKGWLGSSDEAWKI